MTYSRKYNATGGTFTGVNWTSFVGSPQACRFQSDNSTGQWTIAVTPGNPIDVSTWWDYASNRTQFADFQVLDGANVVATATLNQQLSPSAAAAAATPPLPVVNGTADDANATDDTTPTPLSAVYAILWSGTPTSHSLTIKVHKDASDTSANVAIADDILVRSNSPIPQPAKVNAVQVGPSGRIIAVRLTDQLGNDAIVQSVNGGILPTLQVNGGAGNGQAGSTGTIQLATPIWASNYQTDAMAVVSFPISFPIAHGDAVSLSFQDSWCSTSAGACSLATGLAADNLVGVSFLPIYASGGGRQTMKVGTNITRPDPSMPVLMFSDLTRQLGDWQDLSGHYDFTRDSAGNLTGLGSAPYIIAQAIQPAADPSDGTKTYGASTGGVFTLVYHGGAAALQANDGTTTASTLSGPTVDGNGDTTIVYQFTKGASARSVTVELVINAAPCVIKHIYAPDPAEPTVRSLDGSSIFHPSFLAKAAGYTSYRFMDALQTNDSNVINFADFNSPSNLSYARQGNATLSPSVASIGPYANTDNWYAAGGAIPILVTTSSPHGLSEGQFVTFSGFVGPGESGPTPPGNFPTVNPADTVTFNGAVSLVHYLTPTTFAVRLGTNTVAAVAGEALARTYSSPGTNAKATRNNQIGIAPADCINLCNANHADIYINAPHAASDDCLWNEADPLNSLFGLIAATLAAGLKCRVECSNETWNSAFLQNGYFIEQAQQAGIAPDQWYVVRMKRIHDLAAQAFAHYGRSGDLIRILATCGGDAGNTGATRVNYAVANNIPFQGLGPAPYFWSGPIGTVPAATFDGLNQAQRMDLAELYISGGYIARYMAANYALVSGLPGGITLQCYEGGPEYGGLTGTGDLGARSRAWARDPRMRGIVLYYLATLQGNGTTLFHDYQLCGNVGSESVYAIAGSAMWPAYVGTGQVDGLGDGTDGLFDNRTNYDDLGNIVSVVGGALKKWIADSAGGGGGGPRRVFESGVMRSHTFKNKRKRAA